MTETMHPDARILIVDDQDANLRLLERILTHGGYTCYRSLGDPRQVVAVYQEFQPDLLLLDLIMPYLDGVAVMEQLRPLTEGTYLPILVLTADVTAEARRRALTAGAKDFLTKPLDAIEVLLRIANLLQTRFLYRRLQEQAARKLQAAQQRLEQVVASSPAVLFSLAVEGDRIQGIAWMSENVQEMLGYAARDTVGPTWWWEHIHPEDREAVAARTHQELLARGRLADEYRFRHRDGSYRWLRSEKRLLRDAAGHAAEIVGSWSDVTERKRLEDEVRQAQKMEAVGRLASGVAHDFNNVLTVIIGYSEMMLGELRQEDSTYNLVREIRNAGKRGAGLTRQLLAFSRKQVVAPVVLDLNSLVSETERLLRRLVGEDVTLATLLDPAPAPVKADPGQLEQVLMNLVVNARDAMPRGGQLTIETRNVERAPCDPDRYPEGQPGPWVLLAVSDTGCGMDEATRAWIFEPFFTTKEAGKGTGLGLATVYGIVKQSGGCIEVDSEPGRGATFRIYLPRLAEEGSGLGESQPGLRVLPHGTGTVLLVEDEEGVRSLSSLALRSAGYTVLEAEDGAEALEVCQRCCQAIDLLVTDVVMPKMSGRQLADHLASVWPSLKVLFMSGYTEDTVLRHGVQDAGTAFLEKPFTPSVLARKVHEVLGH